MATDFKYIIKRIIIGVGIAFIIMYLKGGLIANVYAITSSYSFGAKDETFGTNYAVFTYSTNGNPWTNYSDGTFTFSFQAYKTGGDSISSNALLRHVVINSSNGSSFACNVGTTTLGNSTFTNGLYSASCPVTFDNNAYFKSIVFYFDSNNAVIGPNYRFLWNGLITYSSKPQSNTNVNLDTSSTTSAINNQISNDNSNTQSIINNQDSNTQDIIDNQNQNTQDTIESQQVCTTYDKSSGIQQGYFNSNGTINTGSSSSDYVITDFINITGAKLEALTSGGSNVRTCFFNTNKSFVSCINTISVGVLTIPTDATYVRFSIQKSNNRPTFKICQNGNQAIVNSQESINNTLNDDNVDTEQAGGFFNSFQTNSHGLSGIITSPLRLIQSLSSSQCSPLVLPLPFVNQSATIPCMSTVYSKFPTFLNLWQLISTGLIAYYILVNLFSKVHSMQNPQDDRIEVLNL